MVFDNRITNDMDKAPDINVQIEQVDPEAETVKNTDLVGKINNVSDIRDAFADIQREIPRSAQSADLTELYRQAGDLIDLLETSRFERRVGDKAGEIRRAALEEFTKTARKINSRAKEVNAKADYALEWGG